MLAKDIYNQVKKSDNDKLKELESLNPMDRLDPCCQKEIDSERRKIAVMSELKKDDRTNLKYKLRQSTIDSLKGNNCICCHSSSLDYPALAELRGYLCQDINPNNIYNKIEKQNDNNNEYNDNDDNNSDNDSDLDLLDEVLTPYEQELLDRTKQAMERLEIAKSIGLAKHVEANIDHLSLQIQQFHNVILHIYDPESMFCANIDIYLEELSKQYMGSIFRRINCNNNKIISFKEKWKISTSTVLICCFRRGELISSTSDINLLWDGDTLQKYELKTFFDNTHCLTEDVSISLEAFDKFSKLDIDDENENDVDDDFNCDEPGCSRKFRHEHIKSSRSIVSASKSQGSEALNENVFYRV